MKIGIVSDTHDNLALVAKAIDRLNRENVEVVLHAGDYVSPFTISNFKQLRAKLIGVFGNNDGDRELLKDRFDTVEAAEVRGNFAEVTVGGLRIALLHGGEEELLTSLVNTGFYDVVVHGHSHVAGIHKRNKTIVVNPGEVCGYLTEKSTLVLFDTATKKAEIVQL